MQCRARSRDGVRRARDGNQEYIVHVCHVTGFPQSFLSTLTEGIQVRESQSFLSTLTEEIQTVKVGTRVGTQWKLRQSPSRPMCGNWNDSHESCNKKYYRNGQRNWRT